MASKIGKKEWVVVFIVMGVLDFIQFVIIECILVWFFGAGIAINEILDPIVGIIFAIYLFVRGLNPSKYWKSYASILGMEVLEEVTGGIAQLWVLDVWYIHGSVKKEEAELEAQRQQEMMLENQVRQPVNQNGVRLPETQTSNTYNSSDSNTGTNKVSGRIGTYGGGPLNVDGIRYAVNQVAQTSTGNSGGSTSIGAGTSTGTSNAGGGGGTGNASSGSSSVASSSGGGSSGGAGK